MSKIDVNTIVDREKLAPPMGSLCFRFLSIFL